jgi:hypothetical protein
MPAAASDRAARTYGRCRPPLRSVGLEERARRSRFSRFILSSEGSTVVADIAGLLASAGGGG